MKTYTLLVSKYKLFYLAACLSIIACQVEEINKDTEPEEVETSEIINPNSPQTPPTETPTPKEEEAPETIRPTAPQILTAEKANLSVAEKILELVNKERSDRGLSTIKLNTALNKAALDHSVDMDRNNYFDHSGLDGSSFSERSIDAGYLGSPRGENIGNGYQNAEDVHNGWMTSDGHRENILNPNITDMGIGESGKKWTQIFGVSR